MAIRKGTKVKWNWGSNLGRGKVEETYTKKVTKHIHGTVVTRYGQKCNKVLLIRSEEGSEVLKLENEVERDV